MALRLNQYTGAGRLTADPIVRKTTNSSVAHFHLAVKDWNGKEEITHFIECECWAGTADNIAKFFKKGDEIIVLGRLKQDKNEERQINKTIVVVDNFSFPGGSKKN